jgi:hypothetical protein
MLSGIAVAVKEMDAGFVHVPMPAWSIGRTKREAVKTAE